MSETGFGSLSFNPLPEYNDWGFGSPTPVELNDPTQERAVGDARDTAFGSPFDTFNHPIVIQGDFALIPDDGGVNIKLQSRWTSVWNNDFPKFNLGRGFLGPFYITYINKVTNEVTQAVSGRCYTNYSMNTLYAGVPPLDRGVYHLEIKWQEVNTIRINDAFTVAVRPRVPEAYNIRKHIPSHLNRGPTILKNDPIGIYYKNKESNLSSILKSLAERLQDLNGRPTTALNGNLAWGDASISVETTLGFPDSGVLLIAGHRVSYTAKTATSFTGTSYSTYWPDSFSIKEEVNCDVAAIK